MTLRCIKQLTLHIETFRNIEMWYQGIYYLNIQIYFDHENPLKRVYAYPYAVTESHSSFQELQKQKYDSQIISHAEIVKSTSSFQTKAFHLKYFEEEVDVNDICHFKIETDSFSADQQLIMEVCLNFYDSYKKQSRITSNFKKDTKQIRRIKFQISSFNLESQIHEYIPLVFEDQYFCQINTTLHAYNSEYKFRMMRLQLSEFANLSDSQKKQMLERLKPSKQQRVLVGEQLAKDWQIKDPKEVLERLQEIFEVLNKIQRKILQEYKEIFNFVITDKELKFLAEKLTFPENLQSIFDSQNQVSQSKNQNPGQKIKENPTFTFVSIQNRVLNLLHDFNYICGNTSIIWNKLTTLIQINPQFTIVYYQKIYEEEQKNIWSKFVTEHQVQCEMHFSNIEKLSKAMLHDLENNRNNLKINTKVVNSKFKNSVQTLPLMIKSTHFIKAKPKNSNLGSTFQPQGDIDETEEPILKSPKESAQNAKFSGLHLIVLVHGFQGTSYDMKMIKNNISYFYPEAGYLCCTSNEDQTDGDIFEMGKRIANEVKSHILQNFDKGLLGKISFIGHSLGGLIIRAALPYLLQYRHKFEVFMSFSSPHLGYKVNTSSVVQAGIWVIQKVKESQCLKQLTMTDNSDPYDTALYQLSKFEGMGYFSKIYLFSSKQDSYAPFESARIEINPSFEKSTDSLYFYIPYLCRKNIHCQMVKNILSDTKRCLLKRVDISFKIEFKNLDSFIGRTAHILFLEAAQVIKQLIYTEPQLFS